MPQHPTPVSPTVSTSPTDFQTRLLTRLDEIIGLLEILADRDDFPDPSLLLAMDEDEVPYGMARGDAQGAPGGASCHATIQNHQSKIQNEPP